VGRVAEARLQIAKALEQVSHLTLSHLLRTNWYADAGDLQHLLDGLRKAGLPE
jgi:hypothetical protein